MMKFKVKKFATLVVILTSVTMSWLIYTPQQGLQAQTMSESTSALATRLTKVTTSSPVIEGKVFRVLTRGVVEAEVKTKITSEVSGKIVKVNSNYFERGHFSAEEVLVKIDDSRYQNELAEAKMLKSEAEMILAEEKGRVKEAKLNWRNLKDNEANSLFMREPQLAHAQSKLAYAHTNLTFAERNLNQTKIKAPFSGNYVKVHANIGQYISPGDTLAEVVDATRYIVRFSVTDHEAKLLGMNTLTQREQRPIKVNGLLGGESYIWSGNIIGIEPSKDRSTGMYTLIGRVELTFTLAPAASQVAQLPPPLDGMFVEVEVEGKHFSDVWQIPRAALHTDNQVFTVTEDSRVRQVPLTILHEDEHAVWALNSTKAHEPLVLRSSAPLQGGQLVAPEIAKISDTTNGQPNASTGM
jgi:RND family efflux transporter MFP subunit